MDLAQNTPSAQNYIPTNWKGTQPEEISQSFKTITRVANGFGFLPDPHC